MVCFLQKIGEIKKQKEGKQITHNPPCHKTPNLLLICWYTSYKLFSYLPGTEKLPSVVPARRYNLPFLLAFALGTYTALWGTFSYVPFNDFFFIL